jgi:hypothetical protein
MNIEYEPGEVLGLALEASQVEIGRPPRDIDQEVYVAAGGVFPTGNGSEDTQVRGTMAARDLEQGLTILDDDL